MADSIRQRIMAAVDAALKTVTKANGYETDIGVNVFSWKASPSAQSSLPLVEYRDAACEAINGPVNFHTFALTLEVEVVVMSGATTPAEIRKAIADVYKLVGQNVQWSGLAINTLPEGDAVKVEQADKIIAGALVRFRVIYRTLAFDPYNQQ